MAVIVLPRSLVALFPGADRRVMMEGRTVRELIDGLDVRWPGMRDRLCDPGPVIREYINVFVDGESADLSSAVADQSVVQVLLAVAGG